MSVGSRPEVGGWAVTEVVALMAVIFWRGPRMEDAYLVWLNRGQRTK